MANTLPCERVQITDSKWLNAAGERIESASVESEVDILLDISGFAAGDSITVIIADYLSNGEELKKFDIIVEESNTGALVAKHEKLTIEKTWLFKELIIIVKADGCKKGPNADPDKDYALNEEGVEYRGERLTVIMDYVNIRIKVLDVRSGENIQRGKVKDLRLMVGNSNVLEKKKSDTETGFELSDNAIEITASNNRIKASIKALQKIMGKQETNDATYTAALKTLYEDYWNTRAPEMDVKFPESGNPSDNVLDFIIREYNDHLQTDTSGVLNVWIPAKLLDKNEARIEVGFWNFPVVKERTLNEISDSDMVREWRPVIGTRLASKYNPITKKIESWIEPVSTGKRRPLSLFPGTGFGFDVRWGMEENDEQDCEWGEGFNWWVWPYGKTTRRPEFELKTAEKLVIKDTTDDFISLDKNLLSDFFDHDGMHFVLFGMQWCQPVYDGIEDPDPNANPATRSNDYAFVNMKRGTSWIKGLNMHIPSKHKGSSGAYYGIFDVTNPQPRSRNHKGVDLYSGLEGHNPAFAIHAGKLVKNNSGGGLGYCAGLLLQGANHPSFLYAHLNTEVTAKDWVMAGEIVGICGLTNSVTNSSVSYYKEPYHLHLEFFKIAPNGTGIPSIDNIRSGMDDFVNMTLPSNATYSLPTGANAFLFQGNKLPLLLPCKSVYCNEPNGAASLNGCKLSGEYSVTTKDRENRDITVMVKNYSDCFAVAKFPYDNNRLLANITDMNSTDLQPIAGLIRFICPHILSDNADVKAQLQAKIKYLHINKNRFTPALFSYKESETSQFNSFFTSRTSMKINGNPDSVTKAAIRELIRAHYYCAHDGEGRILSLDDEQINDTHIQEFIKKYENPEIYNIPETDDYSIIRGFYDWFNDDAKFDQMCWNAPTN